MLGHIISKDGIHIDPTRVQAIQQLYFPRNKEEVQSFNGKINFLRRFIPNLAEHLKVMKNILKKDSEVKCSLEANKAFHPVKFSLSTVPILISLDYTSDLFIFSFASEHTLVVVLMQKKDKKNEQPIAFFSHTIRDGTLRYNIIEKQALAFGESSQGFLSLYSAFSHHCLCSYSSSERNSCANRSKRKKGKMDCSHVGDKAYKSHQGTWFG